MNGRTNREQTSFRIQFSLFVSDFGIKATQVGGEDFFLKILKVGRKVVLNKPI